MHLEIEDTLTSVLNTSLVEMEEAKTTYDICAELNVTEVQTKVAARFAVLLDLSLLGKHTHTLCTAHSDGNTCTCTCTYYVFYIICTHFELTNRISH